MELDKDDDRDRSYSHYRLVGLVARQRRARLVLIRKVLGLISA